MQCLSNDPGSDRVDPVYLSLGCSSKGRLLMLFGIVVRLTPASQTRKLWMLLHFLAIDISAVSLTINVPSEILPILTVAICNDTQ